VTVDRDEDAIARLEIQVGRLLQAGVAFSAVCLGAGLAIWMVFGPVRPATVMLTGGLIVLMITPLARVVASLVAYIRLRDWLFVAITLMVFVVLIAAWIVKS
jgi:uncharacterized membrane protein